MSLFPVSSLPEAYVEDKIVEANWVTTAQKSEVTAFLQSRQAEQDGDPELQEPAATPGDVRRGDRATGCQPTLELVVAHNAVNVFPVPHAINNWPRSTRPDATSSTAVC